MGDIIEQLSSAPLGPIVVGAALLLFGWVLYRAVLAFSGGVLGAAAGYGLGLLAVRVFGLDGTAALATAIGAAVVGLILGVLVFKMLHRVAFFVAGAVLGGWAYAQVFLSLRQGGVVPDSDAAFAFGIMIAAVLCGLLMILLAKYLVTIASAAIGTLLLLGAYGEPVAIIPAALIFFAGVFIQLKLAKMFSRKPKDDD